MKKTILVMVLLLSTGCDLGDEVSASRAMLDQDKVWIFAQFNVQEESDGMDSYFYYGKVSKSIYESIRSDSISKGFILLEEVKYWGDNDLVYEYRDAENAGELVFRIEDIARLKLVSTAPVAGKGYEQFEETPPAESDDSETPAKSSQESIKPAPVSKT